MYSTALKALSTRCVALFTPFRRTIAAVEEPCRKTTEESYPSTEPPTPPPGNPYRLYIQERATGVTGRPNLLAELAAKWQRLPRVEKRNWKLKHSEAKREYLIARLKWRDTQNAQAYDKQKLKRETQRLTKPKRSATKKAERPE